MKHAYALAILRNAQEELLTEISRIEISGAEATGTVKTIYEEAAERRRRWVEELAAARDVLLASVEDEGPGIPAPVPAAGLTSPIVAPGGKTLAVGDYVLGFKGGSREVLGVTGGGSIVLRNLKTGEVSTTEISQIRAALYDGSARLHTPDNN